MPQTSEDLQAAFGYLFPDEVTALKQLARMLPSYPIVVNIGSGSGTSSLALLEARPDLYLYCIDVQLEDSPFGCLAAERKVLEQAGFKSGDRFTQVHADSKDVGIIWHDTSPTINIDMVFVDGDHSYRGAKGDILAWLPNIKPGGIMAVHDYGKKEVYKRTDLPAKVPHPLPWPGVDRAVRKFLCPNYEIVLHVDTLIAFRIQ